MLLVILIALLTPPCFCAVTIAVDGDSRTVRSDGLPDHPTGAFPNRGNPNSISAQQYSYRVPLNPKAAQATTALGMYPFGVALNGVPFDPFAAEWWMGDPRSGWQYEPM